MKVIVDLVWRSMLNSLGTLQSVWYEYPDITANLDAFCNVGTLLAVIYGLLNLHYSRDWSHLLLSDWDLSTRTMNPSTIANFAPGPSRRLHTPVTSRAY